MEWSELYHSRVARRNGCQVRPFEGIFEEHSILQKEFSAVSAELKQFKHENAKLVEENELLNHDLGAKNNGKGSAPRVKSLEAQIEVLQVDLDDFRRSQQRVICKYDDDLSETKRLLEKSEEKCKRLQRERDELTKNLESTGHDLRGAQETILQKNTELEETERQNENLLKESLKKLESLQHVKLKSVTKAVDDLKAIDTVDLDKVAHLSNYVVEVAADAIEMIGEEGEQEVRGILEQAHVDMQEQIGRWMKHIKDEINMYTEVLLKKETWSATQAETRSRNLSLLMPKVASTSEFFTLLCFPSYHEWNTYCTLATDALLQCVASASTTAKTLPSLTFRLNTISHLYSEYEKLLVTLSQAWAARPSHLRDSPSLNAASLQRSASSAFQAASNELCNTIAQQCIVSVQKYFDEIYTIDMAHYKKYKHKDSYSKHNKHLKQAATTTMKTIVEALETKLNASPVDKPELLHQVYNVLLREVCVRCNGLFLSGGPTRWYYPEQSSSLEEELARVKRYFTSKGMSREAVSNQFSRLSAIISTVMSQPSENLISGGGLCLQFSELPEEAKGSVWSRITVRKVLAHRKDKKAKQFTLKQAKKKK
eukprot:TRINITY_DN20523_c0_g1_i1.p1 TRINITY_DN20523_c0_g1~~TRINITY_DN20523_c0_g1_i1.p1  ORF type:complete len:597 (+),score=135.32 TRINITY_DN20523_c0_g1_i1:33-1823(+)